MLRLFEAFDLVVCFDRIRFLTSRLPTQTVEGVGRVAARNSIAQFLRVRTPERELKTVALARLWSGT